MTESAVLINVKDGIRFITLNRPETLNAMNADLVLGLLDAVKSGHADPETKVMVLSGAGKAFCAGDDLGERRSGPGDMSRQELYEKVNMLQDVTREIVFGDKIVIGAIHGWAVGGGFEWAINCDFSIWGQGARAFFPEVKWGMFVTGGVTALLPAIIGAIKTRELILFGEKLDAAQLLDLGIAWRVVADDQVMAEATRVAQNIASLPEAPVRNLKRALGQVSRQTLEIAMAAETQALIEGFLDPETTERIKTFEGGAE